MSPLVRAVRDSVDGAAIATRCRKDGCAVHLTGLSQDRVLVDLDRALEDTQDKRCDFLFAGKQADTHWVVLLELKRGGAQASQVAQQLQGGAAAVSGWLPQDLPYRFRPVLAHGKGLHRSELAKLRRVKIRLNKQNTQPELIRCRSTLLDVLK